MATTSRPSSTRSGSIRCLRKRLPETCSRGSRPALTSRLRFRPEKLVVVAGEEVALPVGLEDVVEVVGIGGVERGLDRLAARAADGSRRQSLSLVGVVRRVYLQVGERETSLRSLERV